MQTYDCKLRLGGNVANEVRKADVTAPEIFVLRALHGEDAVSEIVPKAMDRRSHEEERQRLYGIYANPEQNNAETVARKIAMFRGLFGHDTMPLPKALSKSDPFLVEPAKEIKRARTETAGDDLMD